jgi:hypothetical protein
MRSFAMRRAQEMQRASREVRMPWIHSGS